MLPMAPEPHVNILLMIIPAALILAFMMAYSFQPDARKEKHRAWLSRNKGWIELILILLAIAVLMFVAVELFFMTFQHGVVINAVWEVYRNCTIDCYVT